MLVSAERFLARKKLLGLSQLETAIVDCLQSVLYPLSIRGILRELTENPPKPRSCSCSHCGHMHEIEFSTTYNSVLGTTALLYGAGLLTREKEKTVIAITKHEPPWPITKPTRRVSMYRYRIAGTPLWEEIKH